MLRDLRDSPIAAVREMILQAAARYLLKG